ncbi:hypothetical protein HDU93_002781 [Gonapodya sp. JEL0774]|nr:hypothetical protein HDU93_002781 [Gonapodya sp. JEL0774]
MSLPMFPSALAASANASGQAIGPALTRELKAGFAKCTRGRPHPFERASRRSLSYVRGASFSSTSCSSPRKTGGPASGFDRQHALSDSCPSLSHCRRASALPPAFSEWLEWHNHSTTQDAPAERSRVTSSDPPIQQLGEPDIADPLLHPFMKHTSVDLPQHADILRQLTGSNPFADLPNLAGPRRSQQESTPRGSQSTSDGIEEEADNLSALFEKLESGIYPNSQPEHEWPSPPPQDEVFAPGIAKRKDELCDSEMQKQFKHITIPPSTQPLARMDTLTEGVSAPQPVAPLASRLVATASTAAVTTRPVPDGPLPPAPFPNATPFGRSTVVSPLSRVLGPATQQTVPIEQSSAPPKSVSGSEHHPPASQEQPGDHAADQLNDQPPAPPSSASSSAPLQHNPLSHPRDTLLDLLQLPSLTLQDRQLISSALSGRSTRVWETVGGWVVSKYAGALAAERNRRTAAAESESRPRPQARKSKINYHKRPKGVPSTLATLLKYQEMQKAREDKERRTTRTHDMDDDRWDDRED